MCTVRYHLTQGKTRLGSICPERGIRHGDPLSPYLFILHANDFLAAIQSFERNKWITRVKIFHRAPSITHMFFANDNSVYCRSNMEEANNVKRLLDTFENATGQKVNCDKSSIFFSSSVAEYVILKICLKLNIQEAGERTTKRSY